MRLGIWLVDSVAVIIFISCLLAKQSVGYLLFWISIHRFGLLFYFLFEIVVGVYSALSFVVSDETISGMRNPEIAFFFTHLLPFQCIEFVVFFMVVVCYLLSCCNSSKEKKNSNYVVWLLTLEEHVPIPIPISMDAPSTLNEAVVSTTSLGEHNSATEPLLQDVENQPLLSQPGTESSESSTSSQNPAIVIANDSRLVTNNGDPIPPIVPIVEHPNESIPVEIENSTENSVVANESDFQSAEDNVASTQKMDINENNPPSLANLPPPPSHKNRRNYNGYGGVYLPPSLIEEMKSVVRSMNEHNSPKEDNTKAIEQTTDDKDNNVIVKVDSQSNENHCELCCACKKNPSILVAEPCEDVLCVSCCSSSRCPACGCIICGTHRIVS